MNLKIKQLDYIKLQTYPHIRPSWTKEFVEMGGMAYFDEDTNTIYDLFLIEGTGSHGSWESGGALHTAGFYKSIPNKKHLDKLKVYWHVHPDTVFFSQDDREKIELVGETMPYVISIITNRKAEILVQVDVFRPCRFTEKIEKLVPILDRPKGLRERLQQDVDAKVKKPKNDIIVTDITPIGSGGFASTDRKFAGMFDIADEFFLSKPGFTNFPKDLQDRIKFLFRTSHSTYDQALEVALKEKYGTRRANRQS